MPGFKSKYVRPKLRPLRPEMRPDEKCCVKPNSTGLRLIGRLLEVASHFVRCAGRPTATTNPLPFIPEGCEDSTGRGKAGAGQNPFENAVKHPRGRNENQRTAFLGIGADGREDFANAGFPGKAGITPAADVEIHASELFPVAVIHAPASSAFPRRRRCRRSSGCAG